MKHCPTCNRSFNDDALSFCLEDGTPLIREPAGRADSQETLVSPSPSVPPPETSGLRATQTYGQIPGKGTVAASQINVPTAQPSAPAPRRIWPWLVAILAIVFILIGGLVVAAIVIPPMLRASRADNRAQPTPVRSESTATPTESTPTPKTSPAEEADDVPDDEDAVLSQLTKLEDEWTQANVKGDKQALEKILADEYSGGANEHNKREYIDSLTPDPSIKSWELKDLTVDQNGDRATVHGTLSEAKTNGTEVYNFVDTFVWRDHRWQAVASHTTGVK
jgi:Domain of unknown function (DUF4440)